MRSKLALATITILVALSAGSYFAARSKSAVYSQEGQLTNKSQCPQYSLQLPRKSRVGISVGDDLAIKKVQPGTPADLAGLRTGDVVTGLNANKLTRLDEFQRAIASTQPGTVFTIDYLRFDASNVQGQAKQAVLTTIAVPEASPANGSIKDAHFSCPTGCCQSCTFGNGCLLTNHDTGINLCFYGGGRCNLSYCV